MPNNKGNDTTGKPDNKCNLCPEILPEDELANRIFNLHIEGITITKRSIITAMKEFAAAWMEQSQLPADNEGAEETFDIEDMRRCWEQSNPGETFEKWISNYGKA
jgi:hypothetical protein